MMGVPPSGSGHSPEGGAASSTASPAKPSVPNAFTPGPWSWCECYDPTGRRLESRDIIPAGGHSLSGVAVTASVFGPLEDAHLIAAAPELYEALKAARCALHGQLLERADAALAKARGEQVQS